MAVEWHRPREESVSVSVNPDQQGDYYCDGAADDVQINAALTYISGLGGGSVVCLQGTYVLAATVNVPANCTLLGVGWATIFNYNAGGNAITITGDNAKVRDLKVDIVAGAGAGGTRPNCVFADTRDNLELFGLWLIGDETVADDGSDVRQCGIVFSTVTNSRIIACKSDDHKRHGIAMVVDSDYNELVGNTCQSNAMNGIDMNACDQCTVSDNVCSGNASFGIYMHTCLHNTVSVNVCQGNADAGIDVATGCNYDTFVGNACQGNSAGIRLHAGADYVFSSNNFSLNTGFGMWMYNVQFSSIVGNVCTDNRQHGIFLNNSHHNGVSENSCNGNDSGNTGTYDGINLINGNKNVILGNVCKNNDRWGIMVDDGSDDNKVSMNYTEGNTSGSIRVNNANCDKNQLEFNTVEEGAPGNVGTATRSYGNYDPSADAFVGDVGVAPF